jgi:hypothetical protein
MARRKIVGRRTRVSLALALAGYIGLVCGAGRALAQTDVLFLNPTLAGGTGSLEYLITTTPTSSLIPGSAVPGLGLTADIVSTYAAWTTPPQPYSSYKAIVFGDPNCTINSPGPMAAALTNIPAWTAAVTGNVVIIGTDPTAHAGVGGARLWRSAIDFATSGNGTGAVIVLSCYYSLAAPSTRVDVLNGFGTFRVTGVGVTANTCDVVTLVPTVPTPTGISATDLSGWHCSVHEWFDTWDSSFTPFAIVTDLVGVAPNFTALDGTQGNPYILVRRGSGLLKVCKVAGAGVAVSTPITFTAGGTPLTVPAGPGPGGFCVVGPALSQGSTATVAEAVPPDIRVSSISVAPPDRVVGTPDLEGGSVVVSIGSGVTEVTFTNEALGFLEICKRGNTIGNSTFTVNPGGLGPFVVPAGACSPPVQVRAGTVVITELPAPRTVLVGCETIPSSRQSACNLGARTSTVTVVAGDVSTQTVAVFTNQRTDIPPPDSRRRSRPGTATVPGCAGGC